MTGAVYIGLPWKIDTFLRMIITRCGLRNFCLPHSVFLVVEL